ncbi:rhodanese-related sulfurtransferase [soil metagenome]
MESGTAAAGGGYLVLLYYKYTEIGDPSAYVDRQRHWCEGLGLLGRILVADEGINGTVSGTVAAARAYMAALRAEPTTRGITFKVEPSQGHVFKKLVVKRRDEIVTLGLPPGDDIDPRQLTGERLSPVAFREVLAKGDALVLDGRNRYESALGRFAGAVCPDVNHFRDFPAWIQEHLRGQEDRPIVTYCTGGIRCEKLTGYLLREGFTKVAQLDGGIVSYGQDPETRGDGFDGRCYVFDGRVATDVNRTPSAGVLACCHRCGASDDRYVNCAVPQCNAQIFLCGACEAEAGRFCGDGTCAGEGMARSERR